MAKAPLDSTSPDASAPKRRGRPKKAAADSSAPAVSQAKSSAHAPRIAMEASATAASYEWSPSHTNAGRSNRAPRGKTHPSKPSSESAAPAASGEDYPTSFKAAPTDETRREDAPRESRQEPREGSGDDRRDNRDGREDNRDDRRDNSHDSGRTQNDGAAGASEQSSAGAPSNSSGDASATSGAAGDGATAPRENGNSQGGDRPQGGHWQKPGNNNWRNNRGDSRGDNRGGRFDRFNNNKQGRFRDRFNGNRGPQNYGNQSYARPALSVDARRSYGAPVAAAVDVPTPTERLDGFPQWEVLTTLQNMEALARTIAPSGETIFYNDLVSLGAQELLDKARTLEIAWEGAPHREKLLVKILETAFTKGLAILAEGIVDFVGEEAILVFGAENYRIRAASPYLPKLLVERYGLKRGTQVKVQLHTPHEPSKLPIALVVLSIAGEAPDKNLTITPFEELTPYYPTKRLILETSPDATWDNLSMRVTDLLTPIGLGQRGLIVAPPRTGKTILLQGMANAIATNNPEVHLIVLLIDERPEEVTDFKRMIKGEVVSSTFDETPMSHTHAAEIVIEKSRRMVERGGHVVILLDSITRLARAYNALTGSSGKIMSGGVDSNALQKPKRFFGSARNIEGGGSLTIIGTALIDTGSKMDEVIFEEFKGTGNMELHLDRALVDKRLFPAFALDRSGTRKEELLYHPDEMQKVYGLRRAMKGVTPLEAMEMLLARVKKTRTNIEFLMGLAK